MRDLAAQRAVILEGARRLAWPCVPWRGTHIRGAAAWQNAVGLEFHPAALSAFEAALGAHSRARDVARAAEAAGWPPTFWRGRLLAGFVGWRRELEAALAAGRSWREFEALRQHLVSGTPLTLEATS